MSCTPSHITVEIPLENGGTLTLRSRYSVFLQEGLKRLKSNKGCPPMEDDAILKIIDTVISACATGAASTNVAACKDEEVEKKKGDMW